MGDCGGCFHNSILTKKNLTQKTKEIKLDTRMANCVLQAYVNLYKYDEAHDWYLMMKDDARIHPNIVSFHTIARAFAKVITLPPHSLLLARLLTFLPSFSPFSLSPLFFP